MRAEREGNKDGLPCHGGVVVVVGGIPVLPYMAAEVHPPRFPSIAASVEIGGADSASARLHTDKSPSEREIGRVHMQSPPSLSHTHKRTPTTLNSHLLRALKQCGFSAAIVTLTEQRQIMSISWATA